MSENKFKKISMLHAVLLALWKPNQPTSEQNQRGVRACASKVMCHLVVEMFAMDVYDCYQC